MTDRSDGATQELLDQLRKVNEELRKVRGDLEDMKRTESARFNLQTNRSTAWDQVDAEMWGPKTARESVLELLAMVGWPLYSRQIAILAQAMFGRVIPSTRFGVLVKDEMTAFLSSRRRREVWLCNAVTHDRHLPIRRLWARSDWNPASRVLAPLSGRVQHLKFAVFLCEIAQGDAEIARPDMIKQMAVEAVSLLSGIRPRGDFDYEAGRNLALAKLSELEADDAAERERSAEQLQSRPEFMQLFGVPDLIDGTPDAGRRSRVR